MELKVERVLGSLLALLLVLAVSLAGSAGLAHAQLGIAEDEGVLGDEEVTPLADVAEDPEAFEDEVVTVEDALGRALGRTAFTFGDEQVLVITTEREGFGREFLTPGTRLRVVGEPGVFDQATFEREFGLQVNPRLGRAFAGRPFIAADPVDLGFAEEEGLAEDEGLVEEDAGLAEDEGVFGEEQPLEEEPLETDEPVDGVIQEPIEVQLEELTGAAELYEGWYVLVEGVMGDILDVNDLTAADLFPLDLTIFTLESEEPFGNEVLVVTTGQTIAVDELETLGDEIRVTGEVIAFDLEIIEEQFGFAPDPALFEEFGGGTVIFANSVEAVEAGVFDDEEVTPLAEIAEDPEAFENEVVTVEDELGRAFGRTAFTLGDEGVLAIATERAGFDPGLLEPGTVLRAPGEVGIFDLNTFEEEFGLQVNPRLARPFVGRPFIAVDPVDLEAVDEGVLEDEEPLDEEPLAEGPVGPVVLEPMEVELEELTGAAEFYEGQYVLVEGALGDIINVEEIAGDFFPLDLPLDLTVFTVESEEPFGNEVLVVTTGQTIAVEELETLGDEVRVTGEVIAFDLEVIEEQFGFAPDPAVFEDFGGGTVIFANSVEAVEEGVLEDEALIEDEPLEEEEPLVEEDVLAEDEGLAEDDGLAEDEILDRDREGALVQDEEAALQEEAIEGALGEDEEDEGPFEDEEDALAAEEDFILGPTEEDEGIIGDEEVGAFEDEEDLILGPVEEDEGIIGDEDEGAFEDEGFGQEAIVGEAIGVGIAEEEVTELGDVAADPEAFEGQEITVEDEVGEAFGRAAFTFGDEEVLVVSTERPGFARRFVRPGARLRIVGEPGVFDIRNFEREFGIRLNTRLAERFEGRAFIPVAPTDVEAIE